MGSQDTGCKLDIDSFDLEKDYDRYKELWGKFKQQCPDKDVLSQFGLKVECDGELICAGFLYDTGCSMCMFEWFVVNKDAEKRIRNEALDLLLKRVVDCAKMAKYRFIYTATHSDAFIKRLKEYGFNAQSEKRQVHMFCEVEYD